MIDLYCERVGDGYLAEPVNALSNIVFLIVAYFAWKFLKKHFIQHTEFLLLVTLTVAIGLGSLSFHVFASKISQWADLIPIFMFQLFYFWLYTKSVWCYAWPARVVISLVLLVSIIISSGFEDYLNGSILYVPTLVVLIIIVVYHSIKSQPEARLAGSALIVFSLALVLRTLDNDLCQTINIGSHFIWHLLTGLVIYLMFKILVLNRVRD